MRNMMLAILLALALSTPFGVHAQPAPAAPAPPPAVAVPAVPAAVVPVAPVAPALPAAVVPAAPTAPTPPAAGAVPSDGTMPTVVPVPAAGTAVPVAAGSAAPAAGTAAPVLAPTAAAPAPGSGTAAAAEPLKADADAAELAALAVTAARAGQWNILVGVALMILISLFNRLGMAAKIGRKYVPWVTVILGVVGSVGYGLAAGELWYTALMNGLFAGTGAIALWEMIVKPFTTKKTDGAPRKITA